MKKTQCSEFTDNKNNLQERVKTNTQFGDNDLTSWLIGHLAMKKGDRVLDIGCGDGNHLRHIAPIVARDNYCVGIDYDRGMIDKSKALSEHTQPKITFVNMDMDKLSESRFDDKYFDLIYSVYAFYYSKNIAATLGQMKKKLRDQGKIAIVGPTGDNNKNWFDFLNLFMKIPAPILQSSTTFMDGIEEWANKNFRSVKFFTFTNTITIPTLKDLRNYWVSNIYYEKKYDPAFEGNASSYFKNHTFFRFAKIAKMILMEDKK
ncbi:class I SAM-dependent methyltransferase [Patescibacteria group bacterium]|nr:class I SAM-dependent methyltransferase [Patescibacteria group bacterium]